MNAPQLSLKKREILRGYQTFSRVISEGHSLQKGAIRCFFATAPGRHGSLRVGFSVSRSVRNAVERNRARRWMKEAYRRNKHLIAHPSVPTPVPIDIVFMIRVRERLLRAPEFRAAIDQAMTTLLKELHVHLSDKP